MTMPPFDGFTPMPPNVNHGAPQQAALQWGYWLPGPREVRGLAVGAYFLAGEGGTGDIGALRTARELRKELRKIWQITGVLDDRGLAAAGAATANEALALDPIIAQFRAAVAAGAPLNDPRVLAYHVTAANPAIEQAIINVPRELGIAPATLPTSVAAWDLARRVQMARQCVTAGYVIPTDAWAVIADLGDQAANTYATWQEFAWGFEFGRALFVSIGTRPDRREATASIGHTRPFMQGLLQTPGSPWSVPLH